MRSRIGKYLSALFVVGALITGLQRTAAAATPTQMTVQGRLTRINGTPITGTNTLTFKIYDAQFGGNEIWPLVLGQEAHSVTSDANGLWTETIGTVNALTDAVFAAPERWLEIIVDDGANPPETLPRIKLNTNPYSSRISTVDGASGGHITSKVTIGPGHTNTGADAFVAGLNNTAAGNYSNIGGGYDNTTSNDATTIGGGAYNTASGFEATVAGGYGDTASGDNATVAGGHGNVGSGAYSFIGGGLSNLASGTSSTVTGGSHNVTSGPGATVGGGQADTASGQNSTIAGGAYNRATALGATVGGGHYCYARSQYTVVAGGGGYDYSDSNSARSGWSTISGGARNSIPTAGQYATIAGGYQNSAAGYEAAIGGGANNVANGNHSVVGGGYYDAALATGATVCGGESNTASGTSSTAAGGKYNTAAGSYSLAAGYRAKALHTGSWVWADNTEADFATSGDDQFLVRAAGGVGVNTDTPYEDLTVNGSLGFENGTSSEIYMFESGSANGDRMIFSHSPAFPDWGLQYIDAGDKFVFLGLGSPAMTVDLSQTGGFVGFGSITSPSNIITLPNSNTSSGRALGFAWDVYSSRRWKTNIQPLEGALDKVQRLQGVSYDPKEGGGRQIGLIAEDVGEVIPEIVQYEENGFDAKSIDYARLVAVLIEAVKEQQKRIDHLEATIRQIQP